MECEMDLFDLILLFGGLAFFLYGMTVLSSGLEKMAGGKLEQVLKRMTSSKLKSLALGAGITFAIQSSSAMTVMLVGLVNSGVMNLGQSIGVIMGSNIGTTLKAWLFSLSGIENDNNILLQMLKPDNFSLVFALVGVVLLMMPKKQKRQDIAAILLGFAVLMYGMKMMGDSVSGLENSQGLKDLLLTFANNPILGVVAGAVVTSVIQSSSASVGILIALAANTPISIGAALPIIMGQNIGTCVTALISSIGVNKNAKRVAVVHVAFNIIGTILFLLAFYALDGIFDFAFVDSNISTFGVATIHTVFNVITTIILMPFTKMLEKIARFVVKDKAEDEEFAFIDERLLKTPSVAISECYQKTIQMADMANETMHLALGLLDKYDENDIELIREKEALIDKYEDKLGTSLVRLSGMGVSEVDGRKVSKLLHTIGDFERVGDHAVNLMKVAGEIHEKGLEFSKSAMVDIDVLKNALRDILDLTMNAFARDDVEGAKLVEPLEQVIDRLINKVKQKHIERLQRGTCTIEMGFVLSDLLNNIERVSDHCSNIAVTMIEINNNSYETHEYLDEIKVEDESFKENYKQFKEKYAISK